MHLLGGDRRGVRDHERARLLGRRVLYLAHQGLCGRKQHHGAIPQDFTGRRQRNVTTAAVKQLGADLLLQVGHRLADGLLGEAELLGSPRETGVFGHR
ncbi:Uncharacterised protein [Mycobacteroides abscessus subsp. abscessus]|nr:Uncharacterised protein [Mycobacteroides abscessus subsp. abscessus]